MAHYIDKDALVAEIKRRKELVSDPILSGNDLMIGERNAYFNLLSFIDSMQEEPVSEDLERAAGDYEYNMWKAGHPEDTYNSSDIIKAVKFGAQWKEQQMMAKAVDATVHIDAGGYPYIPQMELYDYDNDIPLAKEGDKYKVILIKEE